MDDAYNQHSSINKILVSAMKELESAKERHLYEAKIVDAQIRKIHRLVKLGHWWELNNWLTPEQIELLSDVEPLDRDTLLEEDWW